MKALLDTHTFLWWNLGDERLVLHQIIPLPIQLSHALHVFNLPEYHLDPFDRMLVAQSQLEKLPILTADPNIDRYEVDVIWWYGGYNS